MLCLLHSMRTKVVPHSAHAPWHKGYHSSFRTWLCDSQQVTCGGTVPKSQSLFHEAHFLPAGLFWKPVKGNSSASTRTFEKSLDGIMPEVVVVILYTGLQRLEIGVITLSGRKERACETCSEGWQQQNAQRKASLSSPILRSPAAGSPL